MNQTYRASTRPTRHRTINPVGELSARHGRLARQGAARDYAFDLRSALSLPDALAQAPEPDDHCEIALTDLRERALQAVDGMLSVATPYAILASVIPSASGWWISVSGDGSVAAHVAHRLSRLHGYAGMTHDRLPAAVSDEVMELGRLLDVCEMIIATARACVAAFDFGKTLDGLLALEQESGAHE